MAVANTTQQPFWFDRGGEFQSREDAYKSAYSRALAQYNLQSNQLKTSAGVNITGRVEEWGQDPSKVNFDIDSGNQFGSYQQMRYRGGEDIQNIDNQFDTSQGTTGYQGELGRRSRQGQQGELTNWRQSLLQNIFGIASGVQTEGENLSNNLQSLGAERTAWDAQRVLDDPVVPGAAPGGGDTPAGNDPVNEAKIRQSAASAIDQANRTGDLQTLSKIFWDMTVPENLRKMADSYLHAWRLKAGPREGARARANPPKPHRVTPDPAPSVPKPDRFK